MIDFDNLLNHCRELAAKPGGLGEICALLRKSVPHYDWVGFYIADAGSQWLDLGPFDGEPTEHVRIPFGRGICGQAAATGRTFIVDDVTKESNYLSCSTRVKSEIVLPIFDADGRVIAELDIDSHTPAAFGPADREFLERLCRLVGPLFGKRG